MAQVTAVAALPVQRAAVRSVRPINNASQKTNSVHLTVRGRRVVALLALLPIVVAFFLMSTRAVQADQSGPTTAIVKVEAGQSLWDVAVAIAPDEDPRSTIWTIKALNGLETSEVQAGQALVVPAQQ
jgi:hypothetical protein